MDHPDERRGKVCVKGRFAVNGDNNKARLIAVFDIMRDGEAVTVVLLRYSIENDLVMRPIVEGASRSSPFSGVKTTPITS